MSSTSNVEIPAATQSPLTSVKEDNKEEIPTATQPPLTLVKEDDWWVKHWVGDGRPFGRRSSSRSSF